MSGQEQDARKEGGVKHVKTGLDKNRMQLEKLMKNPAKPVVLPEAPKEKSIRPPREMVKNVQGSSAGAGSGEFHVYKASRRREYERLAIMEEQKAKETTVAKVERKRKEREEEAEAKTAKNRARRKKRKERGKAKGKQKKDDKPAGHGDQEETSGSEDERPADDEPFKKRRLVAPVTISNADQDQGSGEVADALMSKVTQPVNPVASSSVVIHDED